MTTDPRLITCAGVDLELPLLPHFLDHYASLGVPPDRTHVILNGRDLGSPNMQAAQNLLKARGCAEPEIWGGAYTSAEMWSRRRTLQAQVAAPDEWVLNADLDELHEYPDTLPRFLAWCTKRDTNAVQGVFIDRLSQDGGLAPVASDQPIAEQFPVQCDVACTLFGVGQHHNLYGTIKLMAHRGVLMPGLGGHHPQAEQEIRYLYNRHLGGFPWIGHPAFRFAIPTRVHHYKWTASLEETLRRRLATPGVSHGGAEYGGKILSLIDTGGGRMPLERLAKRQLRAADLLPWRLRTRLLRRTSRELSRRQSRHVARP